jgi:hypothetical protein
MSRIVRSIVLAGLVGALGLGAAGCQKDSGGKSSSKSGQTSKRGLKEEDKPRVEEKYGFTTEQVGG